MNRNQTQVIVGNDNQQTGTGDITNINVFQPSVNTIMLALIKEYKKEQQENVEFSTVIDSLNHYLNPVKEENDSVLGLEKKLKDGGYSAFLPFALYVKDKCAKTILKYTFSKAAQEILVFLLAEIYTIFMHKIYPLILTQKSSEIVMETIHREIIEKIELKLEENVLAIYADTISGMIYYLTGNCHIKWC